MTKRMLIDDTQPEETRVVIVDGNKVEDVEFESSFRKQIKGNIYTAKVIRVEPSLQAAFIDYGGNKHGFLAFGEIHPDYYNISEAMIEAVDREVDEIIERKKQYLKEREEQRERIRAEKRALYEARLREEEAKKAIEEASKALEDKAQALESMISEQEDSSQNMEENASADNNNLVTQEQVVSQNKEENLPDEEKKSEEKADEKPVKPKRKYTRRKKPTAEVENNEQPTENEQPSQDEKAELKVLANEIENEEPSVCEDVTQDDADTDDNDNDDEVAVDTDDDDNENDFELQKKLIKARKLYHYSTIQDVIKEGQTLLVQVVKEERGNKGAAFTTYLSLAGRYCVLMPNRIKSGGVSRKITNAADRKRLKEIMNELPLGSDMSMIIRTAGEEKTRADIVRDYNYLIRTWNQIRIGALKNKVPSMIYEEGNLIKRALRDMFTKDIAEVIVDGNEAFKTARDFVKILSPSNLRKIKTRKSGEMPVFQRFQVESQLDKLHNPIVQLESGGYLVINPTEALVSIDVNSGRATKEKDIEETALKTNLEAADEIARQLKMRDLAGLIVIDFIDMDEPKNNSAVEKRMKEALKNDRARIQIAKMSCFGLLEISRQRMHSSFMESNYQPCPYCHGQGFIRTTESGAMLILRAIEEEGTKNRSSKITVYVPTDTAIYLLNQKRQNLCQLESRYKMNVIISADNELKTVSDYKIERVKAVKVEEDDTEDTVTTAYEHHDDELFGDEPQSLPFDDEDNEESVESHNDNEHCGHRHRGRRLHYDRRRKNYRRNNNRYETKEKESAVVLYSSHDDINLNTDKTSNNDKKEGKTAWWRRLIG
ncbi:MAG: Rne/Rng family ribonuclease [Alphaproteobacteria bacterium]|nr:Rne/Rng family ribonuclease [Alphaproteobacteria bacterium]